jgi:orotate phosphoribosyltransferase
MKEFLDFDPNRLLEILAKCGGFYECRKGEHDKRLTPLVGYAGRDEMGRQFVGDVYANFAKLERHSNCLHAVAVKLMDKIVSYNAENGLQDATGFCGAPMGGLALATVLAQQITSTEQNFEYIFPEKKIIEKETSSSREKSELIFDRHEPEEGTNWWIVEDVANNFSTTLKLVELIESYGAKVAGIVCFLNRSPFVDSWYTARDKSLPVISLVRKKIEQYKQDDPFVASDILSGNVCWKPKKREEWARLKNSLESAQ